MGGFKNCLNTVLNMRWWRVSRRWKYVLASVPVLGFVYIAFGIPVADRDKRTNVVQPPTTMIPRSYLCMHFSGGIGNQMFQYASTYGLATLKNMTLVSIADSEDDILLNKIFQNKLNLVVMNDISVCGNRTNVKPCAFDESVIDIKGSADLYGYFQSWRYFSHVETDIRQRFIFNNAILRNASRIIAGIVAKNTKATGKGVTLVGVHIRRGDMLSSYFVQYGYKLATKEYLQEAVGYIISNISHSDVVFVVCSNDLEWSREALAEIKNVEYMEGNTAAVDMAVLSSCDHIITTVGSFGWWSAWLLGARGRVIYYKYPATNGSALRMDFSSDMSDFFYPGWIGMGQYSCSPAIFAKTNVLIFSMIFHFTHQRLTHSIGLN